MTASVPHFQTERGSQWFLQKRLVFSQLSRGWAAKPRSVGSVIGALSSDCELPQPSNSVILNPLRMGERHTLTKWTPKTHVRLGAKLAWAKIQKCCFLIFQLVFFSFGFLFSKRFLYIFASFSKFLFQIVFFFEICPMVLCFFYECFFVCNFRKNFKQKRERGFQKKRVFLTKVFCKFFAYWKNTLFLQKKFSFF